MEHKQDSHYHLKHISVKFMLIIKENDFEDPVIKRRNLNELMKKKIK